jgi:hypothetical protein
MRGLADMSYDRHNGNSMLPEILLGELGITKILITIDSFKNYVAKPRSILHSQ